MGKMIRKFQHVPECEMQSMPSGPIRVLLIAGNDENYQQIADLFTELPTGAYTLDRVKDYESAVDALRQCAHDVFLVDERLGQHEGMELLSDAARLDCRSPMILLTTVPNVEASPLKTQAGAAELLEKDQLHAATLEGSLQRALQRAQPRDGAGQGVAGQALASPGSAEAQLRDLDRRKDEFLAAFVHELRNPLSPLSSAVQLIRMQPDQADQVDELAAVMERQLAKLVRTIENAVDMFQILGGKLQLRRSQVALNDAVAVGLENSRAQINEAGLTLQTSLPQEAILVDGDSSRLSQVVNHLLVNAMKHTSKGGTIHLSLQTEGPHAAIRIRDTGVGIAPEMQARLSETLAQVDRGGLGTNLTLVKALVGLHGGSVHAFSRGQGTGSEFTVYLPLAGRPASLGGSPSQSVQGGKLAPLRVLVVDDTKSAANLLAKLFETLGQTVEVAFSGKDALERVTLLKPHLVVSDVEMPDVSGLELARRIRANPNLQQPKLVALTGYDRDSDRRSIIGAGFDRHLTKPIGIQQIEQLIAECAP
jgi:signal transduction histidine kinase